MANISIDYGKVTGDIDALVKKIQSEIIDASANSRTLIMETVENSSGDFIEALKEEVNQETAIIQEVGELLIAMAQYVQSAADSFAGVDRSYDVQKCMVGGMLRQAYNNTTDKII